MSDADPYRLPGSYRAPRFRYGRTVWCAVRGEVEVVGLHEAPIPWPVGKRGRARSLVVFKGLAREPAVVAGLRKATAKSGDPARRAKLAAAMRGKKMDRRVVEALAAQRRGTRHREESRRRMSEAHRRRGTLVPGTVVWTGREDALVRSLPAAEAARRTGRMLGAVWKRRRVLGLPDGRRKGNKRT